MIEKLADPIPIWMVLSAAFGFLLGELAGDYNRRRKYLQRETGSTPPRTDGRSSAPSRNNGASSTISTAVYWLFQEASKNAPRKTHRIKGRISPIRPFHNLYLLRQNLFSLST